MCVAIESTGTVVSWRADKGTGVVQPDNGDREVWVHIAHIEERRRREPRPGERVRVVYRQLVHGPSGRWHGEQVWLLGDTEAKGATGV